MHIRETIKKRLREERSEPKVVKARTPISIREGEKMWELIDEHDEVVAYVPDYDDARAIEISWNKAFGK